MSKNLQKRQGAAFDLIYLFRWGVGSEDKVRSDEVKMHELDIVERLTNIKDLQKRKASSKTTTSDSSNKIKILDKAYRNSFIYYWVCIDPSFSPQSVFEEFSKNCMIGKWDFLNPFTYEPTDKLCYYVSFDTKYKDKFINPKYFGKITKKIVDICKIANPPQDFIDSNISSNNVSFYTYASISEAPSNISGRAKSKLTNLFNTEIPELKEEFLKKRRNPEKFPWSGGTFYALSSRMLPHVVTIQSTLLDSVRIPDKLEELDRIIPILKKEIREKDHFDPHELSTNMVLMYKIQRMREKLNEKSLFEGGSLAFEVTHRTESIPTRWGIGKCENENTFNDFVRNMHQYLIESTKSSKILKVKEIHEAKSLNILRIAASHDIGMNYNGGNKDIRQNAGKYYFELIGKTIPIHKDDFLALQTKILHSVYKVMSRIYDEQIT